jgi:hypothetical protein
MAESSRESTKERTSSVLAMMRRIEKTMRADTKRVEMGDLISIGASIAQSR